MFSNDLLLKYVINKYDAQFNSYPQLQNVMSDFNIKALDIIQKAAPTTFKISEVLNNDKLATTEKITTIVQNEITDMKNDFSNGLSFLFKQGFNFIGNILEYLLEQPVILGGLILILLLLFYRK